MQRSDRIEISKEDKPAFNWTLFVSIVLYSFLILIRDIGNISVSRAFFVVLTLLISIVLPYKSLRSFSFFYMVGGAGVYGGALATILVALMIKSKKKNILQFVFTLIILLIELLHFSTYTFKVDFNQYFVFGIFISFFFFLLFEDYENNNEIYNDLRYYVIGTAVTLFIIVLHSVLLFGVEETLLGSARLGTGFEGEDISEGITELNANFMAYYSVTAMALILFTKNLFNKNWLKYVLLAILVLAGIMSSSRTWLLVMALVVIIHFIVGQRRTKFEILIVVLFLIILAFKYTSFTDAVIDRFSDRFEEENLSTAGRRTEVFAEYNQYLEEHPEKLAFGTGCIYYRRICNISYSTHNGTQQLLVCCGLFGVLMFVCCGMAYYRRYRKKNKMAIGFMAFVPFFICVVFLQSIQFIYPPSLMLPLVAALMPLKLMPTDEKLQ
jgi:hypothetical protein